MADDITKSYQIRRRNIKQRNEKDDEYSNNDNKSKDDNNNDNKSRDYNNNDNKSRDDDNNDKITIILIPMKQ